MSYAPRILIVDDEDELRAFFTQILLEKGYDVMAVATARQALRTLGTFEFDLVVLDLSLPDGDGLAITRQIRAEIPHLHILAISGFMMGDVPHKVIAAGASATLHKPTTSFALRQTVSELVATCAEFKTARA